MDGRLEGPGRSAVAPVESSFREVIPRTGKRVVGVAVAGLSHLVLSTGTVAAHAGETHATGAHASGGLLVPTAILAMGTLVIGASVYLDRAGEIEDWMGRAGVLLGIVGLLVGGLLALV